MDFYLKIGKKEVEVTVIYEGYLSGDELNTEGLEYVNKIYNQIENALNKISQEYLELYNDTWSSLEDGYPIMTHEEFIQQFKFDSIYVSDEKQSGSIWFTDNGVMGEHSFQVDFDKSDLPESAIMMG